MRSRSSSADVALKAMWSHLPANVVGLSLTESSQPKSNGKARAVLGRLAAKTCDERAPVHCPLNPLTDDSPAILPLLWVLRMAGLGPLRRPSEWLKPTL